MHARPDGPESHAGRTHADRRPDTEDGRHSESESEWNDAICNSEVLQR